MIKFTRVLKKEIIQHVRTGADTQVLIRTTCENIDGRTAIGLTWVSERMYTDSQLDIDNILLDITETAMIAREEEE